MGAPEATTDDRVPSVIVSHLDVVYKVYGVGKTTRPAPGADNVVTRWINRGKRHMGVREVHAVKDVSFIAYKGESIGIVGRNGSGKSTLLRAVAGLIPAANGEVYHHGQAALLGVSAVLARQLTGARNVFIGAQALGLSKQEVRERYKDIVRFAGIGEFINLPMSSYSSGMASRLRFAISTASVPDILVVDEALSTGDAEFRQRASDRIEEFRKSAGTVFMVSHNASTIKAQCTRAIWMEKGEVVMDGPSGEVVDAYQAMVKAEAEAKKKKQQAAAKKKQAKEAKKRAAGSGSDKEG
ncbi:ABC transporter ATP-binding protein [Ornithinicoccus hortensis]|uniref:Teichoic acid transport system ATP-binding protein n=1 Tax=Ornithinicoccus hortensis TaxID=82346 RepID=A0A542YMY2_9MICO|nr:ATP-binding cassette domain-containing protein [Ornithinicoccus hortensis]TQL49389.1 teichoic acid transport system ATP-binding protein [Ornithinicoccus hortensis]